MDPATLVIHQQIPQEVFDACPGLNREFIQEELADMHDIDITWTFFDKAKFNMLCALSLLPKTGIVFIS